MSFNKNKLVLVSQHGVPGAPKLWLYTTADAIADVNAEDYFLSAIDILNLNDILIIVSSTGGTPAHTIASVIQNDGTNIDISDGNTIDATDSN